MKKAQRGFAVLATVLILLVVAMLVGAGWYVWSAQNKANQILSDADAANSSLLQINSVKSYEDCLNSKTSKLDKEAFSANLYD